MFIFFFFFFQAEDGIRDFHVTGVQTCALPIWAGAVFTGGVYTGELRTSGVSLSERLSALARLVQIGSARVGPDGFNAGLLADAEALLARAGGRLRLSSQHTIAVLAGGTGSGKSSL